MPFLGQPKDPSALAELVIVSRVAGYAPAFTRSTSLRCTPNRDWLRRNPTKSAGAANGAPPAGEYTSTGCITRNAVPFAPSQVTKSRCSSFTPGTTHEGRATSNGSTNDVLEYGREPAVAVAVAGAVA